MTCSAGGLGQAAPRIGSRSERRSVLSTTVEEYMPMYRACYNMCKPRTDPLDFESELYCRVKAVLEKYLADAVRPWACVIQRLVSLHRCIRRAVDLCPDCLVLYIIIRTSPSVGTLTNTLAGRRFLRYLQASEYVPATAVPENALHGTVSSS